MKICMIAPGRFPLPGSGSVEICIWETARRLAARHDVTVISRRFPGLSHQEKREGVRLLRLPADMPGLYLAEALNIIRSGNFGLVQVDNRPHVAAAVKQALPRTPVVLFLHSLTFVPQEAKVRRSLSFADLIAVNSRSLADRLLRRFPGLLPPLRVVPLGADLSRFSPLSAQQRQQMRRELQLPRRFTVLFTGRLIPRKGADVLIRAAALLNRRRPVQLIIAGSGNPSYERRLKRLAKRLRLPVIFAGGIPHSDIHRLYQAADCFVCPSQRHESFGLVNVEAMAAALPVIASRIGGIGEVIEHGRTGLLVDRYREASAFARAIESLARAPKTAAAMGLEGRRTALQAFDWERTASRLELLFAGLCRAREHSPARREYDAPSGGRDSLPTRSLQGSHTLPEML